jgi:hypothetical protein
MINRPLAALGTLLTFSGSALADVSGWSVSITPANAVSLEPVYAHLAVNQTCLIDRLQTRVRQEAAAIIITVQPEGNAQTACIPTSGGSTQDVSVGRFHAGDFIVVVRDAQGTQLTSSSFRVNEAHPTSQVVPAVDYTDLWWNPQESGWGISINQHSSGALLATWFTYDQAGNPTWFSLQPGQWTSATNFTGPIYRTTGPAFATHFDASRFGISQVGTGTLSFESPSSAAFTYTVNGISGTRHIERMVY